MSGLLVILALGVAMSALIYINEYTEVSSAQRSRSLITADVVDALIDIVFVERANQAHNFQSILDDREDVLADVDSLLFQRGEFPGSALEMNERDYNRLCRVINRVYQDTHYDIPSTKAYMRAALAV